YLLLVIDLPGLEHLAKGIEQPQRSARGQQSQESGFFVDQCLIAMPYHLLGGIVGIRKEEINNLLFRVAERFKNDQTGLTR
ncbi:MAG: hypothetical protein JWP57_4750, partial [Spirosoma sp.]|nr:hypothetical protein [Spirosoma sp.]